MAGEKISHDPTVHSGREDEEIYPGNAEARNLEKTSIIFAFSIILYAIFLPGENCPQNK